MDDAERIIMQLYMSKYTVLTVISNFIRLLVILHEVMLIDESYFCQGLEVCIFWLVSLEPVVILWKELGEYNDLASVFGGVDKILAGKTFPVNVRALRFALLNF